MTPLLQALVALAFATPAAPPADPITWKIDRTHSELSFRIRHLVSRVQGTFREWEGSIVADPADWNAGRTEITIQTASIDTRNEKRDTHLRSADFFDVVAHPTISFSSTSVQVAGDKVTLNGTLTIRGVSRPVTLTGEALGMTGEGPGKQRIGFHVSTRINRMDYGVSWNRAAEGGGVVLGDEVELDITVAAVRQ